MSSTAPLPYCFVLMPFGKKPDSRWRTIDFDVVYERVISPAIRDAGLEPIRADEEAGGGIIHKAMFERLMLCDYAVADLTLANPNVLYELGVRHGIRPYSTVLVFSGGTRLPFDVAPLRAMPYHLDRRGRLEDESRDRERLADRLSACREHKDDSPLFQLIAGAPRPALESLKTEAFLEAVEYSREYSRRLAEARLVGVEALEELEAELCVPDADPAILVELLLSYRAAEAWQQMVDLAGNITPPLAKAILVREQLGFALNRLGRSPEAEAELLELIDEHGASSETCGLLGRVYKDRWEIARHEGRLPEARGYLKKAVEAYLSGFEADWRDAYPGINAVTLMEWCEPRDSRQEALIPVVRYAVGRRLEGKSPDYWDYATLLELAVLDGDQDAAIRALEDALCSVRESWEPETTARNLGLIREARARSGGEVDWICPIERALEDKAACS